MLLRNLLTIYILLRSQIFRNLDRRLSQRNSERNDVRIGSTKAVEIRR